jgi:hypothetical protein
MIAGTICGEFWLPIALKKRSYIFFCILGCLTPEDLDEPELIGK